MEKLTKHRLVSNSKITCIDKLNWREKDVLLHALARAITQDIEPRHLAVGAGVTEEAQTLHEVMLEAERKEK